MFSESHVSAMRAKLRECEWCIAAFAHTADIEEINLRNWLEFDYWLSKEELSRLHEALSADVLTLDSEEVTA